MKLLKGSTDIPHAAGVRFEKLSLPEPGVDEYRYYYEEFDKDEERHSIGEDGKEKKEIVTVHCATFVAVSNETEPTAEELSELFAAHYGAEFAAMVIKECHHFDTES